MDNFCEQLVKPQKTSSDIIKSIILVVSTILLCGISLVLVSAYSPIISFGLVALLIYFCVFIINNSKHEYEYIFTNGEMDVDKIIAQRKRKRILSIKARYFSNFGKFIDDNQKFSGTLVRADDKSGNNTYFADFKHTKLGNVRLVFSPNKKLIEELKHYIPRSIYSFRDE